MPGAAPLAYSALSAALAGSFAVFPKTAMLRATREGRPIPQPVTAWWLSLGFLAASGVAAAFVPQKLSWAGLLSGALWSAAVVGRVVSIQACGMAVGNATPDVAAVFAGFAFDWVVGPGTYACPVLGGAGLVLLVVSVASLWIVQQQGHSPAQQQPGLAKQRLDEGPLATVGAGGQGADAEAVEHVPAADSANDAAHHLRCPLLGPAEQADESSWRAIVWGLAFGILSGICTGLSSWPFALVADGAAGLHLLLSSSLGMVAFASLNVLLHRALWRLPLHTVDLAASRVGACGLAGGAVLLCSIAASMRAAVAAEGPGFSAAELARHSSIVVSGAWGALLSGELRQGPLQVLFWLSALQMLAACVVVSVGRSLVCVMD